MAFSSYKSVADVQEKFNIKHVEQSFIVANPTTPSPEFLEDLAFVQENIDMMVAGRRYDRMIDSNISMQAY